MAYNKPKTEHGFRIFHKDLRAGNFPEVLFMYGEEEYLTEWACKSLSEKFVDKEMQSMDFAKLDNLENVEELIEACDTFSIFPEKRVVWAPNFPLLIKKNSKGFGEADLEKLKAYIENPNPQNILIFSCVKADDGLPLVKFLKKNCKCYDFSQLDRPELTAFAEKRFKTAGAEISKPTLRYLIDETGYFHRETDYRIFNLTNDIEKIIAYSQGGVVNEEAIDATLHGDLEKFAFDFLDAVTSNRKDTAFRLLNNILGSGGEIYSVLGLLVNQFELMLEAKEISKEVDDRQQIAGILKANSYRVKKALSFADRFSDEKLKNILSQLYQIDRDIKTGAMEQGLALELLIGRM